MATSGTYYALHAIEDASDFGVELVGIFSTRQAALDWAQQDEIQECQDKLEPGEDPTIEWLTETDYNGDEVTYVHKDDTVTGRGWKIEVVRQLG